MGSTLGGTLVSVSQLSSYRSNLRHGHQASGGARASRATWASACREKCRRAGWGSRGGCATTTPLYAAARGVENMFRRGRSQRAAGSREARSRGAALSGGLSCLGSWPYFVPYTHTPSGMYRAFEKYYKKTLCTHTTPGASRAQEFLGRFQKGLPRRAQRSALLVE